MPGSPSLIGWGHQPFGQFPFGDADWSDAALLPLIPEFYRVDDASAGGRVPFPLLLFLNSLKPNVNFINERWGKFPELWDADECPIEQIRFLAATVGVVNSPDKEGVFQRLEILNNPQMILNKGTDKGYDIAGSFEGLTVTVIGLWAEISAVGSPLVTSPADFWMTSFDKVHSDTVPLDKFYTDRLEVWPIELLPVRIVGPSLFDVTPMDSLPLDSDVSILDGRMRSHTIRLEYTKADGGEIEDYTNVSRRVVGFVERFKAQHVTIESIRFNGPKASVTWVESIVSDASSTASWTISSIEAKSASSSWVTDVAV